MYFGKFFDEVEMRVMGLCTVLYKGDGTAASLFSFSWSNVQENATQLLSKQYVDSRKLLGLRPGLNLTVMKVFLFSDKAVGLCLMGKSLTNHSVNHGVLILGTDYFLWSIWWFKHITNST